MLFLMPSILHGKIDCAWAFGLLRPWQNWASEYKVGCHRFVTNYTVTQYRLGQHPLRDKKRCTFSSFAALPRGDLLPFGDLEPFPDDFETLRLDAFQQSGSSNQTG